MKTRVSFVFVVLLAAVSAQTPATTSSEVHAVNKLSPAAKGIKESDRLMQEYMARRAQWVEVRRAAMKQAEAAKTPADRKRILEKMKSDERALRDAGKEAKQQLRNSRSKKNLGPQVGATGEAH